MTALLELEQKGATGHVLELAGPVAPVPVSLSPATRVFLAVTPVDGRKSFNGLYTLVKETLQPPVTLRPKRVSSEWRLCVRN